jgi:hypothetical protein
LSSNAKAFKFVHPGDTVTGEIISVQVVQVRNFKTPHSPVFWDDGRPQEQIVFQIQTDLDEPDAGDDDDGMRAVYVKGWGLQVRALRKIARTLKRMPEAGDKFSASLVGVSEDKPKAGEDPEKIFAYKCERR